MQFPVAPVRPVQVRLPLPEGRSFECRRCGGAVEYRAGEGWTINGFIPVGSVKEYRCGGCGRTLNLPSILLFFSLSLGCLLFAGVLALALKADIRSWMCWAVVAILAGYPVMFAVNLIRRIRFHRGVTSRRHP